jgi:thiosulfate/3-mercaptopyruvate sulfurtransferase
MSTPDLPLILEPETLEKSLGYDNLLIVDLSKADTYRKMHIPGAVHLEYPQILGAEKPKMGLLPDDATLARVLSSIGIDEHTHVVAYDDEGGGRASRWANEGHPLDDVPVTPRARTFSVQHNNAAYADTAYIIEHLENPDCCLLDVRSPDEFNGVKKFADRAGHIPGAVNMEWTSAMDQGRNLRLRGADELTAQLAAIGVTPDREVIVYCQTHHRSAHTYIMLKSLGFERVKGYPGSWSVWGNSMELPVE